MNSNELFSLYFSYQIVINGSISVQITKKYHLSLPHTSLTSTRNVLKHKMYASGNVILVSKLALLHKWIINFGLASTKIWNSWKLSNQSIIKY